jgi:hypothetical protein
MKRTIMLLTVVALMIAMMAITALPAFAQGANVGVGADVNALGLGAKVGAQAGLDLNLGGVLGPVGGLLGGLGL